MGPLLALEGTVAVPDRVRGHHYGKLQTDLLARTLRRDDELRRFSKGTGGHV